MSVLTSLEDFVSPQLEVKIIKSLYEFVHLLRVAVF